MSSFIFDECLLNHMIRKIKGGYKVVAESGRHMGTYKTLKEAKKRLRQIEYFKHAKK